MSPLYVLAALVPGRSQGDWLSLAVICAAFVVVGLGVGIGWPHLLTRVLQVAPADEQDTRRAGPTEQESSTLHHAATRMESTIKERPGSRGAPCVPNTDRTCEQRRD